MEDLQPLITTCKQLRNEARDETVLRLRRQKHAAHARTYRLMAKVKELELANRLLAACWASASRHNDILNGRIAEIVKQAQQDTLCQRAALPQ